MRKILLPAVVLSSSIAFAAKDGYELKVDLSINGKLVSSPMIRTVAGEKASITQKTDTEETFIDVVATEGQGEIKGNKAILMKFIVGTIENGERKILAQPQIMTTENNKAEISIGHDEEKDHLNLSVIAERKSL